MFSVVRNDLFGGMRTKKVKEFVCEEESVGFLVYQLLCERNADNAFVNSRHLATKTFQI